MKTLCSSSFCLSDQLSGSRQPLPFLAQRCCPERVTYVRCPLRRVLPCCTPPPAPTRPAIIMADAAAKAALKKKRTFRKYSYRGIDLDQLLDLSQEQVC